MTCPGLHCPGCSGGQSLAILGGTVAVIVVACETVTWVAEHVWEIGLTVAACFALAVVAGMYLERWAEARGAAFGERHGIYSRADVLAGVGPPAVVRAVVVEAVPERPTLGFRDLHIHLDGQPDAAQVAVIRQALHGRTDQP